MPACFGLWAAIALYVKRLFGSGHRRRLRWIDAHDDDLEVFAWGQVHHLQRADQTVQIFHAQDLALVIDQGKDHRLLAEVVSQLDGLAGLIAESGVQGQLLTQPLVDLDRVQNIGQMVLGGIAHGLFPVGRHLGEHRRGRGQKHCRRHQEPDCALHLHLKVSTFMVSPS